MNTTFQIPPFPPPFARIEPVMRARDHGLQVLQQQQVVYRVDGWIPSLDSGFMCENKNNPSMEAKIITPPKRKYYAAVGGIYKNNEFDREYDAASKRHQQQRTP